MLYQAYELQRLGLEPARLLAQTALSLFDQPFNPLRHTAASRIAVAALDSFEHTTRAIPKPGFGHTHTEIDGELVAVTEEIVEHRVWGDLRHFCRAVDRPHDPKLLLVAPMSGHFATLLRGTVEAFLPDHDVYITDWRDAREIMLMEPDFDLDDYIEYVTGFMTMLGPDTHVIAVCQPAVPVLAAVSLMSEAGDPNLPASMTLIGGPIDTRLGQTQVNDFARTHDIDWFRRHTIHPVPLGYRGVFRRVYPGFLQLAGFMAMNIERHVEAHWQMFLHLVDGDGEPLAAKRAFYEEYRAVMDLSSEYFLQTIATVFQEHLLPRGMWVSRGRLIEPAAVERTALFTIEGERDDISGVGQTAAAQEICTSLRPDMRQHRLQLGVGHYGLFNGRKFRDEVAPRIKKFIAEHRSTARAPRRVSRLTAR